MTAEATPPVLEKFPKTFYYANVIELFERLAHYGFYISLALYLSKVVGMSDIEVGATLGNFRFVGSMAPIPCALRPMKLRRVRNASDSSMGVAARRAGAFEDGCSSCIVVSQSGVRPPATLSCA